MKYLKYVFIVFLIFIITLIYITIRPKPDILKKDKALGKNIYTSNLEFKDIYNLDNQNKIDEDIKLLLKKNNNYKNPLVLYNPYGTNKLSLNVYLYSNDDLNITYIINDSFIRNPIVNKDNDLLSFQVIGLEANKLNKVKIKFNNYEYSFDINIKDIDIPNIEVTNYKEVSDGMYVLMGTLDEGKVDDTYIIDNDGIIRGIIPMMRNEYTASNTTMDNLIINDYMYYNIDNNRIAKVNNLGKVVDIYEFDLDKHHDFTIDFKNNKILILTGDNYKKSIADLLTIYDMNTHKVIKQIDFKEVFKEIYEKSNKVYINDYTGEKIDWIHANSIDINGDDVIIGLREFSSIVCLNDIYDDIKIKYIMGNEDLYKNTSYEKYTLKKKNNFDTFLGNHAAYFYNDNYIAIFNNNYGKSEAINWYDWEKVQNSETYKKSYYELYEINDNSYNLINKFEVPYSPYMSSEQTIDNYVVIYSKKDQVFIEYSKNGEKLKEFKVDRTSYKVNKYDFYNFWFKEEA